MIHVLCSVFSSCLYMEIASLGDVDIASTSDYPFIITTICELIFTFSLIFEFMTTYVPEGSNICIKDHAQIAKQYIHSGFLIDFITWLPFQYLGQIK